MRKLVYDGVPSESIYGIDIEPAFLDLSYELFRDRESLQSTLIAGDLFNENLDLSSITGKMDMVNLTSFFHLFPRQKQIVAAEKIVSFLQPAPGSMIIGTNMGNTVPGEHPLPSGNLTSYRHNKETFEEFWREVGELTGSKWRVNSTIDKEGMAGNESQRWAGAHTTRLVFTVIRE